MDKLQPIIKQRFWILLGLSLILTLFGFFKSQSAIVAATATRTETLKKALSSIPGGNEPNTRFAEGLHVINESYNGKIIQTVDSIYAGQQSRMVWPPKIANDVPKDPKGVTIYRGPLKPEATRNYITLYKDVLIEELWKKAEPVVERAVPMNASPAMGPAGYQNPALLSGIYGGSVRPGRNKANQKWLKGQTILYDQPGFPPRTWAQKLYVDRQAIPQKVLLKTASSETVWDCQEDIWFTELIFDAIRKANREAETVLTAPVRVLSKFELRGGAGAGAEAAPVEGMEAGMEGMEGMEGSGMGGMGGQLGGVAGVMTPPKTEFDPAEVFGSDVAAIDAAAAGSEGSGEEMMGMGMGMGMMANAPSLRWVGPTDNVPFRERGFYLSVIINQQRIPDFLVYLCEGAWPTKVLRFQMGPNPYAKTVAPGAGGGSMYGGNSGYEGSFGSAGLGMSGRSYTGAGSFGGEGGGMGSMGLGGFSANRYPGGPPAFHGTPRDPFSGSLNNLDLVQLDIAGIITFYVPQSAAATGDAPAVDTPSAPGGEAEPVVPATPAGTPATDPVATPPVTPPLPPDGTTPMPPTAPVDGGTPTTPPAGTLPIGTPPAGTAPATTPPAATPPADPPATPPPAAPPAN